MSEVAQEEIKFGTRVRVTVEGTGLQWEEGIVIDSQPDKHGRYNIALNIGGCYPFKRDEFTIETPADELAALTAERDALIQRNDAFWNRIETLQDALTKIESMTRPVERSITASKIPTEWRIHDVAAAALKDGAS